MRSHLNLEHKTFLSGKLPSCVSRCSAVQGILSDRCQYCCCRTDSINENSTELSLGLSSVTASLLSLCPQHYVGLYRTHVFKCMCSSGVMGHLLLVLRYIRAMGALSSHGCLPDTPRQHFGVYGGCLPFSLLSSSPANPLVFPLGHRLGQEEMGMWGALGFFWASSAVLV